MTRNPPTERTKCNRSHDHDEGNFYCHQSDWWEVSIATRKTRLFAYNTSVHLSVLRNAGLVSSTKEGRSVTYRAERGAVQRLATFLSEAAK